MTVNTLKDDREAAIATGMTYVSNPLTAEERLTPSKQWLPLTEQPIITNSPFVSAPASARPDLSKLRQQIDWEHLHQLSDDNTAFEWELLQIFVDDSHACLETLKQAIAIQDYWQIEQSAHHIKGASANVGARAMQAIAAQIERQSHVKQLEGSDRLMETLKMSLQLLQLLITAEVG